MFGFIAGRRLKFGLVGQEELVDHILGYTVIYLLFHDTQWLNAEDACCVFFLWKFFKLVNMFKVSECVLI